MIKGFEFLELERAKPDIDLPLALASVTAVTSAEFDSGNLETGPITITAAERDIRDVLQRIEAASLRVISRADHLGQKIE